MEAMLRFGMSDRELRCCIGNAGSIAALGKAPPTGWAAVKEFSLSYPNREI